MTRNSIMNKYDFFYRQITPCLDSMSNECLKIFQNEHLIDSYRVTFKRVRHIIKPCFEDSQIKYNNVGGLAAQRFNQRIGRFKSDWLEFELMNFAAVDSDYIADEEILNKRLLQETAIADFSGWENTLIKEISLKSTSLLVGIEYIQNDILKYHGMQLGGIKTENWPAQFKIFELIITNAPSCVFIQNRSSLLL